MMKTLFLSLLLIVLAQRMGLAQNRQIDSLTQQLTISKQDTSRVLILAELGFSYYVSSRDTSMMYTQEALKLAQKIKFYRGETRALGVIALIVRQTGNLPKSLELQLKSLKIAEDNHYHLETGHALMRIGNINRDIKDYPRALSYYWQAIKKYQAIQNEEGLASSFMNIGQLYEQLNQLDSALHYSQLAYDKTAHFEFSPRLKAGILMVFGNVQSKLGNNNISLNYYKKSSQLVIKNNDYRSGTDINIRVAQLYNKINQPDSCIYYAKTGLKEAQLITYSQGILASSNLLADVYESKDIKEAHYYLKIAKLAYEELYGATKVQELQKIVTEEQERQREIEVQNLAYYNQIKQYLLLAGLGVFLLIAFILYRNNHQKQKANTLLHQQKEEISSQRQKVEQANAGLEKTLNELKTTQTQLIQREKMASLGELTAGIAHEIQNPLNFVNNFSELSTELVDELKDELAKGEMQEVQAIANDLSQNLQKITQHGNRASSIVKGMLEHSRTSSGQKEPTDLNALADEYLRLANQGFRVKNNDFNCELITDFDLDLPSVKVVPQEIGRVLLNLYNNALYAVGQKQKTAPPEYQPTIWVSSAQVDGHVEIRVGDNGMGIPEGIRQKIFQPFFTTKPTGEGTGLGLSLSYDIVTKGHGGMMDVTTEQGEFTEFIMVLPTPLLESTTDK